MRHGERQFAFAAGVLLSVLWFTAQRTHAQLNVTALEQQAGDAVASLVHEIRSWNKLPALERIEDPFLQEKACARAKKGTTSWEMGSEVAVRNGAVTLLQLSYSTTDPRHPTPQLESWARERDSRDPRRFAVGICLVSTAENPEGRYWIEIETYMGATKSFFYRAGSTLARLWTR
jgi:hypothetical protein